MLEPFPLWVRIVLLLALVVAAVVVSIWKVYESVRDDRRRLDANWARLDAEWRALEQSQRIGEVCFQARRAIFQQLHGPGRSGPPR